MQLWKNVLLISGVLIIIAGGIALLFSALQGYGYYHLLDGDPEMYIRMHRRMLQFLVIGIVLVVIGAVCLSVRR